MSHFFRAPLLSFWAFHRTSSHTQGDSIFDMGMDIDKKKPASPQSIQSLIKTEIMPQNKSELKENSCYICLNDFHEKEILLTMNCNHFFHENCLLKWLTTSDSCPVCRRNIEYLGEKSQ